MEYSFVMSIFWLNKEVHFSPLGNFLWNTRQVRFWRLLILLIIKHSAVINSVILILALDNDENGGRATLTVLSVIFVFISLNLWRKKMSKTKTSLQKNMLIHVLTFTWTCLIFCYSGHSETQNSNSKILSRLRGSKKVFAAISYKNHFWFPKDPFHFFLTVRNILITLRTFCVMEIFHGRLRFFLEPLMLIKNLYF